MKRIKLTLIVIFVCITSYTQVGINTTTPTNDLDINGGVRVRNLTEGTVQSDPLGNLQSVPYKVYAFCVINKGGSILKQFNIANIIHLGNGRYRIFFNTPMVDNDYIILSMGRNKTLTYDVVTTTYFEVSVNSHNGVYDFNILIIDLI